MIKDTIQLSDHFDYKRLLRYSFPTMLMMVFTSIYGVVDGLFVSNVVGKNAFAAINMIIPALMILGGFGTMFGTGGTALVAKTLGEKNDVLANRYFSMMIEVTIVIGAIFSVVGYIFMPSIVDILGVSEAIRDDAIVYGQVCILFMVPMELQYVFQSFMTAAEKPKLGLMITLIAGFSNMLLDALFIGGLKLGVAGAALATGFSQSIGGILPLLYFCKKNDSLLQFALTPIKFPAVWQAAFNGMSELMTNAASSIVSMVYNIQLMKYAGENGVAAYGVLMYVMFIFIAILFGYTMGTSPIISYHYGAGNKKELNNLLKRSMKLEYLGGILMFMISQLLARPISMIFVGYDAELLELTVSAFRIFLFVFILAGGNIFASAFFTALNNGPISAAISFLRSIVFELLAVLFLPLVLGLKGIWCAVAIAEFAACFVSWTLLLTRNRKYGYLK
ncbi:MAG: MATE family efflux transporter [Pseudobutyrivibrio sp.]|nr:MATE family efflux transporter [Pseudobutyrivibrio sp.]